MAMEDTVRVKLTEAAEARKAREIARIRATIASLEADKDKRVKEFNGEIKTLETEIDRLCSEIREGIEVKAQRELFVSDEVVGGNTGTEFTAVAVAGALTDIAKRAAEEAVCSPLSSIECPIHGTCTCVIESDVAKVDCPLHGADSQHAREVKVQPTDPHDFTAGTIPTECGVCGSGLSDPIHDALAIQAGQAAAQEAAQLEAGKDLGADPSNIEGLDNRAALGMVADVVAGMAGPAAGDALRAIGEKVFRSVDGEPPVEVEADANADISPDSVLGGLSEKQVDDVIAAQVDEVFGRSGTCEKCGAGPGTVCAITCVGCESGCAPEPPPPTETPIDPIGVPAKPRRPRAAK